VLRKGRRKLIVNVSSEAGSIGDSRRKTEFAYCMSKSALNMGSKLLQNYLAPEGIKVLEATRGRSPHANGLAPLWRMAGYFFTNLSVMRSLSPMAAYFSLSVSPSAKFGGSVQTPFG